MAKKEGGAAIAARRSSTVNTPSSTVDEGGKSKSKIGLGSDKGTYWHRGQFHNFTFHFIYTA